MAAVIFNGRWTSNLLIWADPVLFDLHLSAFVPVPSGRHILHELDLELRMTSSESHRHHLLRAAGICGLSLRN